MDNQQWLDQPTAVRPDEKLNSDQLAAYLQQQLPDLAGPLHIEQFPSGFSNLTYLIQTANRAFVLRRPPFGADIKSAHDMNREYTILNGLIKVYPKVPRPILYCADEAVIGAPFYLMERLEGVILRPQMPPEMQPEPTLMADIAQALIDNLVALHAVDYEAAGLAELGKPQGYVARQIHGWSKRYRRAQTDEVPEMDRAAAWLAANMPPETAATLIHNDYKYDNVVLNPTDWREIVGVLDWEMATIGDPLMDLGTVLGYWVQADDPPAIQALGLSPTNLPGNPDRTAVVEQYARQSGRDVSNLLFYYIYGLFKLGVIVQQIYARYQKGLTQDPRFANLLEAVRACGQVAVQAIERKGDGL